MKTTKPGDNDLYFRLANAYSIRHLILVTEVEDDQFKIASQGPAIVRLTVAEVLYLLTSQHRAS